MYRKRLRTRSRGLNQKLNTPMYANWNGSGYYNFGVESDFNTAFKKIIKNYTYIDDDYYYPAPLTKMGLLQTRGKFKILPCNVERHDVAGGYLHPDVIYPGLFLPEVNSDESFFIFDEYKNFILRGGRYG